MKQNETVRWIFGLLWLIIGGVLLLCYQLELLDDFWQGIGCALLVVGLLRLLQHIRYKKNPEYREKVDTAYQDERNHFLANKAWAWAGYSFVLMAALASIVLRILGYVELVPLASGCACLLMILYGVCYRILLRKY
ncbi:MAG: hypothetical protein Q4B50_08545 [Bacillota bacterium]|nr:hypothetical protein [Bacillota bacterium]